MVARSFQCTPEKEDQLFLGIFVASWMAISEEEAGAERCRRMKSRKNPNVFHYSYRQTCIDPFDPDVWTDDQLEGFTHLRAVDYVAILEQLGWLHLSFTTRHAGTVRYRSEFGLCLLLFKLRSSMTFKDMSSVFRCPVTTLCVIFKDVLFRFYEETEHHVRNSLKRWKPAFHIFSTAIENAIRSHAQKSNVTTFDLLGKTMFGFVDGTGVHICKPTGSIETVFFGGHHRKHEVRFQLTVAPNGMIMDVAGPVPGSFNDVQLFHDRLFNLPSLSQQLYDCKEEGDRHWLVIGDLAYKAESHVVTPRSMPTNGTLTTDEQNYNKLLSDVRVEVERTIGSVKQKFPVLGGDGRRLKVNENLILPMFVSACVLHNLILTCPSRECIQHNSGRFNVDMPCMSTYFDLMNDFDLMNE